MAIRARVVEFFADACEGLEVSRPRFPTRELADVHERRDKLFPVGAIGRHWEAVEMKDFSQGEPDIHERNVMSKSDRLRHPAASVRASLLRQQESCNYMKGTFNECHDI